MTARHARIETRKTVALDLDAQVTIRMALNDRIRWLTSTLRIPASDPQVQYCVDVLAMLDATPVFPLDECSNCLDPRHNVHAIDCPKNKRFDPRRYDN